MHVVLIDRRGILISLPNGSDYDGVAARLGSRDCVGLSFALWRGKNL